MTKRIFHSILGACLIVVLLSVIGTVFTIYQVFLSEESAQLMKQARVMSVLVNDGGSLQKETGLEDLRICLISPDGTIIFDSTGRGTGKDHSDREEIIQAQQNGEGFSLRFSDSLSEETYNAAIRLQNGSFLRLSRSHSSLLALLASSIWPVLLFALAAAALSWMMARLLSDAIIRPINAIDPEHPMASCPYEQLLPLQEKLEENRLQIQAQMEQIRRKAREFQAVSDAMDEGLILVNANGQPLSVNEAARMIFQIREDWSADQDSHLRSLLEQAQNKGEAKGKLHKDGKTYLLAADAVVPGSREAGFIFLALDITEKEEARRRRQEFTANVTHELKTPLQTILSSSELLEAGMVQQAEVPHFAGYINKEARRMSAMIQDIITLSRLENSAEEENGQKAGTLSNLADAARRQMNSLETAAQMRKIRLTGRLENAWVAADEKDVDALFGNLIENAVHYNKEAGSITVETGIRNGAAFLSVADTGIGIDPALHNRIFERFFTADPSRSKTGTGLGLSIVRHIVSNLKGRIEVDSQPGKGSTFTVYLPVQPE